MFIDYHTVGIFGLCLTSMGLCFVLWPAVTTKRKLIRIPVRSAGVLLGSLGFVALFFFGCGELWMVSSRSAPIYSPDGSKAARIETEDAGALGGFTSVVLYSKHGLERQVIAGGEWSFVDAKDVKWTSDSRLVVSYNSAYRELPICSSTRSVQVVCMPCELHGTYTC